METINSWLSFPMISDSLNHDLAIRQFCPARVEQGQGGESFEEETIVNETELLFSSCHDTSTITPPHLAASEVDELVDSFINVDHHQQETLEESRSMESHPDLSDHFQDDMETFSILNDVLVNMPLNIGIGDDLSEINGSFEDLNNMGVSDHDIVPDEEGESRTHGVDQGLQLVHLLLACAEAVGCRDTQLAESILAQIWAAVNPWGDSLQRVSYCFAAGLKSRLLLLHKVNANGTFTNAGMDHVPLFTRAEKMEAFRLLYQTTPYIAFGFLAANEAICQAAQGKHSLHVIDLGMEHTLQWPSLIRTLASRPEGSPRLRITGLIDNQNRLELEASMRALANDAGSLGIPLEFNMISEPVTPALFTGEKLKLREGEALFVNSIMQLHKFVKESRGSLKAILQAIKKLGPTLLTAVEQDANHNGPFFLGRFLESLHYYSAIFDSLEASLQRNSLQRMKIEMLHFTEEIRNIVAYEGSDRIERHERADQWRRQLGRAGFQVMGLKCMSQARMMLSVYGCEGYTLASEKGCLLLGWKGRPLMLASAWQVHNASSP